MFGWMVTWLVGWLVSWFVGWLVNCFVGLLGSRIACLVVGLVVKGGWLGC